jgi:transcriptional regulator with XRE-family HTH domain
MFFEQEQLEWSRKRLAEVSGVSENTLGRMAIGESRGKFEQVEACFNAMGLALKPKPYSKALYQSRRKTNRGPAKEVRNQMQ